MIRVEPGKRQFFVRGIRQVRRTPIEIREAEEDLFTSYHAWLATVLPVIGYRVRPELELYRNFVAHSLLEVRFYARGWLDDATPETLWVELP